MSLATVKTFECQDCSRRFKKDHGLDEHRAAMHGAERKVSASHPKEESPFFCAICKRNLRNQQSFNMHNLEKHPAAKPPIDQRPTVTEIDATCLECGGVGKLVTGKAIYPHRPDLYAKRFYLCACGAYCGCHPGSIVPLGHPCGPETRAARQAAHAAFDPLWKKGGPMSRLEAYKWLAQELGIDREICHIGMMAAERARRVVAIIEAAKREAA